MADDVKTPVDAAAEKAARAAKVVSERQAAATQAAAAALAAEKADALAKAKAEAEFEEELAAETNNTDPALAEKTPNGFVRVKLLRAHWIGEVRYDPPLRINALLAEANKMLASGVAERTDELKAE